MMDRRAAGFPSGGAASGLMLARRHVGVLPMQAARGPILYFNAAVRRR